MQLQGIEYMHLKNIKGGSYPMCILSFYASISECYKDFVFKVQMSSILGDTSSIQQLR